MNCETAQKILTLYDLANAAFESFEISAKRNFSEERDAGIFELTVKHLKQGALRLMSFQHGSTVYIRPVSALLFYMEQKFEGESVRFPVEALADIAATRSLAFQTIQSATVLDRTSPEVRGGKQPSGKSEHWEARAAYIISRNPNITQKAVADEVGVHPATIGRSKVCREAFQLAIADAPTAVYHVA